MQDATAAFAAAAAALVETIVSTRPDAAAIRRRHDAGEGFLIEFNECRGRVVVSLVTKSGQATWLGYAPVKLKAPL